MQRERAVYVFDAFRLDTQARRLSHRGKTVALLPSTLSLLEFYVRNAGRLVSKNEVFAALWPDDPSPEQNLAQHVYLLRKALSNHAHERVYLLTEHGRGHRFVGETSIETAFDEPASEAQRLCLRGRYFAERRNADGFERAERYFRRAIAGDPSYAPAYAGLAETYVLMGDFMTRAPGDAFPQAKSAALQALALDRTLAAAEAALGDVALYYDHDFERAERHYAQALIIDPRSVATLVYRAWFNNIRGAYAQAVADTAAAVAIAPYDLNALTVAGVCQLFARRYDAAVAQFELVLDLEPGYGLARFYCAMSDALRGANDAALDRLGTEPAPHREQTDFALGAYAARRAGHHELADTFERRLESLTTGGGYVSAFNRAQPLMAAGRLERAIELLCEGLDHGDPWVVFALHHPLCDPLRDLSGFESFAAALTRAPG